MTKKTLLHYATPAIITGMLFATVAVSWDEPPSGPPTGNVPAPINVSAGNQFKEGWLTVGNTTAPSVQLDVQGIAPLLGSLNVTGGAHLNTGGATDGLIVANGNVGIGAVSSGAQLHLEGDSGGAAEIRLVHNGVGGSAGIGFNVTNDSNRFSIKANNNKLLFITDDGGPPYLTRMVLLPDGKIGIGGDPSEKLEVSGGNIKVTGGSFIDDGTTLIVPDYVFDSEYNLKSLSEVEKFILENKHLEGFPDMDNTESWAELSMQDRDMKLLEKIEELTLYIIELEKRVDKLESKL